MKDQFAMLDEKSYLSRVERTMNKLRATCLGQNVRLTAILPEHFKKSPSEEQARQVAEQLLFVLATVAENEDLPNGQLLECRKWLHDVTLYLLEQCNEDDQTFEQMKKLIFLPQGVRALVFRSFLDGSCKELIEDIPPILLKELDLAILVLLRIQGLAHSMEEIHNNLVNMLSKLNDDSQF